MSTVTKLTTEITRRQEELTKLQAQLEQLKSEPYEYQLARELHDKLCRWNHTDGCGWYYETKDGTEIWTGHAHDTYLAKARKLIHKCEKSKITVDLALEISDLLKV